VRVEDFIDDNGKEDLFDFDSREYFFFPCIGCKNRHQPNEYCEPCRHYAI